MKDLVLLWGKTPLSNFGKRVEEVVEEYYEEDERYK